MVGGSARNRPSTGRLALGVGVAIAVMVGATVWLTGQEAARFRDSAYPITRDRCCQYKQPDAKALEIQAREAVTADNAYDVALFQAALGAAGLAGLGLTVYYAQRAWREAQRSADAAQKAIEHTQEEAADQADRFERQAKLSQEAATSAALSAEAMQSVAESMAKNAATVADSVAMQRRFWTTQMRAYLAVAVGGATYQEREKGLYFEARPALINTGHTPAHQVKWRIYGAVLPFPLPADLKYILPSPTAGGRSGYVINPQQNFEMTFTLPGFVPDDDVSKIMVTDGKGFLVWGAVSYRDAFDGKHRTTFCFIQRWLGPDKIIKGVFIPPHNRSN